MKKNTNKLTKFIKKHKILTTSILSVCVIGLCAVGVLGYQANQKYANSQELAALTDNTDEISADTIQDLEDNGGLAELGTEIVDPNTGETVVFTQDENGNVTKTVVKDSNGNSTGAEVNGNTGGNSGGGTTSGDTPSVHTHTWVPHYTQVTTTTYIHHDAVTRVENHTYCTTCGQEIVGDPGLHNRAYPGHTGYTNKNITVVVSEAYDEPVTSTSTVIDYYYCSDCGTHQ